MNTKELVTATRSQCLEYQEDPISDPYIMTLLNEAGQFVYQHLVRSNDMMFATEYPLELEAGVSNYPLPWNAMGKRIEAIFIPSPPNMSQDPWNWVKLNKIDFKQSARYQTNRVRTYFPEAWTQMNNTIYFFPPPLMAYSARLLISRKYVRMGVYGGRIIDMSGNTLTLDELNDDAISENKAIPSNAFICVSSFKTGEIKAMYAYNAVNTTTNVITLAAAPSGRTTYMGYPISALPAGDFGEIELDDIVTYGFTSGRPITSEEFDNLIINWAVSRIRGILHETDTEAMNALKMEIQALAGDLAGREIGARITRRGYMQASGTFYQRRR